MYTGLQLKKFADKNIGVIALKTIPKNYLIGIFQGSFSNLKNNISAQK